MSDPIVGIDLGTSNTVVAHTDATGTAQVLGDANGFKIHPSVVSFHPSGGVVVGAAAKQRKVIDPKNTIYSVKRLIGRGYASKEVQTAKQRMPYQIKEGANQLPIIATRGGEFAVPEISAIILDHAKHVASSALKTEVSRAVVTVPASFNDAQRSATATAGSIAGLSVVRVLNEPTAAALAYGNTRNLKETIAVYDFGGGTFDITILRLDEQIYEVLGTAGDTFLGGDDLDERLVDRMVEKFLAENRVDLRTNEVSMMRLRAVAEQTKIELSRRSRAVVRVDEIAYGAKGKPLDLQIEIRREEFVSQVADIIDRTFPVCTEALKLAGLTNEYIDDVILVGGTTKIPYVRDQVTKFFAKTPRTDVNPEDAVAIGAALQATALQRILKRKPTTRQQAIVPQTTFPDEGTFNEQTSAETATYSRTQIEEATKKPPPTPSQQTRATERAVTRGEQVDRFEERTPPPAPPSAPVIGRLTKNVPAGARTSIGMPTVQPPATPPRTPTTAPRVTAQRPPAVAKTDARTVVVDDVGFPNITTEKGIIDLDDGLPLSTKPSRSNDDFGGQTEKGFLDLDDASPASTAKGFAPPVASPAAPTLMVQAPTPPAPQAPRAVPQPPPQTFPIMPSPASMAATSRPSPVVLDVTPRGLGIGTVAGFCEELIRRNSRVPTETRKLFTTSRDDQDAVRIIVVQGESRRMDSNTVIADLRLDNLPRRPRGETSIEVTFMLDANGILQVRARDAQTGRDTRASLDILGSMPEEGVEASRERVAALRR